MSKQGKELVLAAQETLAHARGRIKLKEFRTDMAEEERELLLQEICAAEPQESIRRPWQGEKRGLPGLHLLRFFNYSKQCIPARHLRKR